MEHHVSVDAAEPPHVLIFQVGPVAPAHALHCNCAFLTSGRNPTDVELSGQPAVLAARRTQKSSSELDYHTNFQVLRSAEKLRKCFRLLPQSTDRER
jgi:hypothetical protein